jgi:hypothetical protein
MDQEQALLNRDSEEMGEWFKRLVSSFRMGYASLSEEQRKFVQIIDSLTAPTQLELIWFGHPDVQYALVTHFKDIEDLEISIDGPFPSYDAVTRLQQIIEKPKWNRQVETEVDTRWSLPNAKNFREIVEDVCVEIVRDLRRLPFLRPVELPIIAAKTLLTSTASLWYVTGNLSKASAQALALEIIDGAKMQAEFPQKTGQPTSPAVPSSRIIAHGGFIFPAVWIGKAPKPTFVERLSRMSMFPSKAYEGIYKDRTLVADQDGFIAIAESDRLKATALLNEIMAVRLLDGKPTYALRELEVIETHIDPVEKRITSKGVTSLSPRASMMDEWLRESWHVTPRAEVVSIQALDEWLRRTERLAESSPMSETLRFLLEAYTHFQNSDYLEAFVLSWLIVEKEVYSRWSQHLQEKNIEDSRKHKLENPGVWTADVVIEELSLAGVISSDDYRKLMSMKTVRNHIIHKGERVSKDQADELLELALEIVRNETINLDKKHLRGTTNSDSNEFPDF